MIQQLQQTEQPAAGTDLAQGSPTRAPPPTSPPTLPAAANTAPAGKAGKLEGTWTAQPSPDTTITVTFQDKGHFTWKVTRQGKDQQFNGTSSYENGILTLVQDQNNNAMVGNVTWKDETHFTFKVMGGGTTDPGLSFTKCREPVTRASPLESADASMSRSIRACLGDETPMPPPDGTELDLSSASKEETGSS